MKQTTLEDLYYGNINPNEICFVRSFEYPSSFADDVFIVDFLI